MTRVRMVRLTQAEERGVIYILRAVSDDELKAHAAQLTKKSDEEYK